MRHLVLLAVLATACDQGATAAPSPAVEDLRPIPPVPPPVPPPPPPRVAIESDADFVAQASVLLDELFAMFSQHTANDCERLAISVEKFAAQNVTRIARLSDYSLAHPKAQQALADALMPRMNEVMQTFAPVFTACSANPRLMKAFEQLTPQQQRPR